MRAAVKIVGKNCLKAISDTFFPNMWSVIRRGTGRFDFSVGAISNISGKLKFLGLEGNQPVLSLSGTYWSPQKENPVERGCSGYCNDFGKSEWEYLLSKEKKLQHVKLKMKKRWQLFCWCQSTEDYPLFIFLKVRNI